MVLGQLVPMAAIGCGAGIAAAVALGRLAQSLLFALDGQDASVIGGSVGAVVLVALVAGLVPAYRASSIDPVVTLRTE
jgi:ABC-type antimicrobial peptide transport system permease subunit